MAFPSGRIYRERKTFAAASTITATPAANFNEFDTAALTGATLFDMVITKSVQGDIVRIIFLCDSTIRTVTLGAGQKNAAATIVLVASEKAIVDYVFDGTVFLETSRSISAL